MITVERAEKIMKSFAGRRILVVGDLMLDRYVSGIVSRISPEAPVPVVHVTDERCRPGGAANVALNIKKLGGEAVVCGVVGNDDNGKLLTGILKEDGIRTDAVVVSETSRTTVKTRIVAERQQVVRVDHEDSRGVTEQLAGSLCARIVQATDGVDGVIIEDYGKGAICQPVVDAALSAASAGKLPVGLDPKDDQDWRISGIEVATPNYKEACSAAGLSARALNGELESDPNLREVGSRLMNKWKTRFLMITLGSHGMYLLGAEEGPKVISTKAMEVFDVSGAGDTVIATALLAMVSGATHLEAALLANYAAGIVVGKLGTATCSPEELLAGMRQQ